MTPLCELARKHETDKGGQHYRYGGGDSDTNHNYTPVYHKMFEGKQDKVTSVFEIGVHAGSSLRMWREYFPNAFILGIDTNADCLRHKEHRIGVQIADQNNPAQLLKVVEGKSFDLIVDDGSHEREHQITSLKTLLPFVKVGGFYVIEDLGTRPGEEQFTPIFASIPDDLAAKFIATLHAIEGGLGPKVQPYEWLITFERVIP
jgi:Methyltransferase domain